jgi:hypothetical protein
MKFPMIIRRNIRVHFVLLRMNCAREAVDANSPEDFISKIESAWSLIDKSGTEDRTPRDC